MPTAREIRTISLYGLSGPPSKTARGTDVWMLCLPRLHEIVYSWLILVISFWDKKFHEFPQNYNQSLAICVNCAFPLWREPLTAAAVPDWGSAGFTGMRMSALLCPAMTCRGLHVDTLDRLPTTTLKTAQFHSWSVCCLRNQWINWPTGQFIVVCSKSDTPVTDTPVNTA